jgi:hypothetical protein
MIAKPCSDGGSCNNTVENKPEFRIQLSHNPASKGGQLRRPREMLATTWGNLLEVENAFCSKNLISKVLSHIALKEHKSNKAKNFDKIIYM